MRFLPFLLVFLFLLFIIPPANAGVQYIEGYNLTSISVSPISTAETNLGVLNKFSNDEVIIYITEKGIRFTAIDTKASNSWIQYEFSNPNGVKPVVDTKEKSVTWSSIYKNVDIKYTLEDHGIKQEIIISDTPPSDTFKEMVTVTDGLTLSKDNGEWTLSKDGTRIFSLEKPVAIDSEGNEYPLELNKKIDGSTLYLEIDASTSLEKCVYPLTIDPTTYSGGYLSFWGSDVYDLPTLYTVTGNDSYVSYDAPNVTYTFKVPVYQNDSGHVMSMDNATILLESNNDGDPSYIRWAGQCDFSDLNVFGWDTVAEEFAPYTDTTRAYVYCDSGATGDIIDCNMSYLGYASDPQRGVYLDGYSSNTISGSNFTNNYRGLVLVNSDSNTVSNLYFTGSVSYALFVYANSDSNTFDNITSIGGASHPLIVWSSYNNTYTDCELSATNHALYIISAYNNTFSNINATSTSNYGIYLNNADNNEFNNCTGNSSSSYGIYVYSGSTGNEFNYCDGISGSSYGIYLVTNVDSNTFVHCSGTSSSNYGIDLAQSCTNTVLTDCIMTSTTGKGTRFYGCENAILTNHTSYGGTNNYSATTTATGIIIIDPANEIFNVEMDDVSSQLTIRNTDGQLFNETATATAYSYSNGSFEMYETGTAETFTVTQYDYYVKALTTANVVVNPLSGTDIANISVSGGTLDWWKVIGVNATEYFTLTTNGTNVTRGLESDGLGILIVNDNLGDGYHAIVNGEKQDTTFIVAAGGFAAVTFVVASWWNRRRSR